MSVLHGIKGIWKQEQALRPIQLEVEILLDYRGRNVIRIANEDDLDDINRIRIGCGKPIGGLISLIQ